MRDFILKYKEHNRTTELGRFSHQEQLDILIKAECDLIHNESAMALNDQEALIENLLIWAKSQWNPNADKSMQFKYPDTRTIGYYWIEEA